MFIYKQTNKQTNKKDRRKENKKTPQNTTKIQLEELSKVSIFYNFLY